MLSIMMPRKLLFVFNPNSGRKSRRRKKILDVLNKFCSKNLIDFLYYQFRGHDDQKNIKLQCEEYKPDAVIAIGGDGTVNMVGEVLVNTSIPLGIIPMGSGNGLAKDLNIPRRFHKALNLIKGFYTHSIDLLKINGETCFHVSDFGFNARVVKRFSNSMIRGKVSYLWYGFLEYFFFKPFQYVIETENQIIKGKAFMITVINGNRFGTDANINPLGQIDDGLFEVCIIKPFPKLRSWKILQRLFNNTIHKSKYSNVVRCKKATIYNDEDTSFHIDGEPKQVSEKTEMNVIHKGLRIIIPCCR